MFVLRTGLRRCVLAIRAASCARCARCGRPCGLAVRWTRTVSGFDFIGWERFGRDSNRKRERAPELMRGKPRTPDGVRPALERTTKKVQQAPMADHPHPLSEERLDRFARHIVLPEVGGAGQAAISRSHVVLLGLGGIGAPALQYLAGAGVGHLTLIDDDKVSASNLQRQTIYTTRDIGHGKAVSARRWLANFDEKLDVTIHDRRIMPEHAGWMIEGADLVIDGTDNFATRLAVSDACVAAGVPLLSACLLYTSPSPRD